MARSPKTPPPLPMPVDLVWTSKHLAIASGSVHRAICTIAMAFWQSGAAQDGLDEATACQVAKMEHGHWNRVKKPVMAALADLLPALAIAHANALARRVNFSTQRRLASLKAQESRRRNKKTFLPIDMKEIDKNTPLQSTKSMEPLRTPQHARPYNNTKSAKTPQQLAEITKQNQHSIDTNGKNGTAGKGIARFVDD